MLCALLEQAAVSGPRGSNTHAYRHFDFPGVRRATGRRECDTVRSASKEIGTPFPCASGQGSAAHS